jgi:deoxyribodipyrimidine photo-lyase
MDGQPVIMWFRRDLRLADNSALSAAAKSRKPVLALYVFDDVSPGAHAMGAAQRWWLHCSLTALAAELAVFGITLILRKGIASDVLGQIAGECGASALFFTRDYDPWARNLEADLPAKVHIPIHAHDGQLLFAPDGIRSGSGKPYKIFTPFSQRCRSAPEPPVGIERPGDLIPFTPPIKSDLLADWNLQPTRPDWSKGLQDHWTPGEMGAQEKLGAFLRGALSEYASARDRPDIEGTSRLSPHLHFGEISPTQCWHATRHTLQSLGEEGGASGEKFIQELLWREFAAHMLVHWPNLPDEALNPTYGHFPWRDDPQSFERWCRGMTGFPIVDAGMRQLWHTGWMHNRVRMIAASFLIKNLLVDWRKGAAWFHDTLVDLDLASNSAGWQWVAGCGTDAAPFFRIFNPVLQGKKFDPDGTYVRRWIPELSPLPASKIHHPWKVSPGELTAANIMLGETYPLPIVDHKSARHRALEALRERPRS